MGDKMGFHMQLWKHFTVNKIPQIFSQIAETIYILW